MSEQDVRGLEETARFFRVSVPTLRGWVKAGAPVVQKGGNGIAYKIDLRAMAEWKRARDEAEEEALAERLSRDKELQLELLGPDMLPDDQPEHLTAAQREALIRSELSMIRLARERGELVLFEEIAMRLARIMSEMRDRLLVLPEQIGRRRGLDDDTIEVLQLEIETVLEALAASITDMNPAEDVAAAA